MASLGKLAGIMIILTIAGGALYYYQDDFNLGDFDFFASGYKIKITSNCEWSAFIGYTKDGEEKLAWLNGKYNQTYEFDYPVSTVSVSKGLDFGAYPNPTFTVEIYKGNKKIFTGTAHGYETVEWNRGIRQTG